MVDQPASSELEVNAVSACQAAGHESRAESQSGAPVHESRPHESRATQSVLAEQLAVKVEQSPTAAPQRKYAFCELPHACATEVEELVSLP